MSITSILRDQPNNVSIVRIETTNTLAEVSAANYILSQADIISNLTKGFWQWFTTDMLLISASDGNGLFTFSVTTPPFTSVQQYGNAAGGGVNPGPLGRIPFYASAGDVVSPLTAVANSVLQTDNVGVTSWSTLLPTGLDIPFYYPIVGAVDSGAANAYVLDTNAPDSYVAAYFNNQVFWFTPVNANSGASTVNVQSIGVVPLVNNDNSALESGALLTNASYEIIYSTALNSFILVNSSLSSGGITPLQIQDKAFTYALDTGAANAYVIALSPVVASPLNGQTFTFLASHANSGASTIDVGYGAVPLVNNDGSVLASNSIISGGTYDIVANNTYSGYVLQNPAVAPGITPLNLQKQTFVYAVDGGAANAYVINPSPAVGSLTDGMSFTFLAANANTGASTLNVSSLGVLPIVNLDGSSLVITAIYAALDYNVVYNTFLNSWVLQNSSVTGSMVTPAKIQNQTFTFAPDSGVADAYVVAYTPVVTSGVDGQTLWFEPSNSNSGAPVTIDVGYGPTPLVNPDGSTLAANSVILGRFYEFYFNTNVGGYALVNPSTSGGGVTPLQIQQQSFLYGADPGGGGNTYVVDMTPAITSFTNGMMFLFTTPRANNGASTININGLGNKDIVLLDGNPLVGGEITNGRTFVLIYAFNSDTFILLNPQNGFVPIRIQIQTYTSSSDTGALNAYSASYYVPIVYAPDGTLLTITGLANTNTGDSTFDPGAGAVQIVTPDFNALVGGELLAGQSYEFLKSNNKWVLLNSSLSSGGGADFPVNTNITSMTGLTGTIAEPSGIASAAAEVLMSFNYIPSAVNCFGMQNAATGDNPGLYAVGSDSDIDIDLISKGTGTINFYDDAGNLIAFLQPTASGVNHIGIGNNATGQSPAIEAGGSDADITLNVLGKGTGGVRIQGGTATGTVLTGIIGETIEVAVLSGSAVSLTSNTPGDLLTYSLPAGKWRADANLGLATATVAATALYAWISTTSATAPNQAFFNCITGTLAAPTGISAPTRYINVSTATNVYVSSIATFGGTATICGKILFTRVA